MSPLFLVAVAGAAALALSASKTINTALKLDYRILKFQIYNFVKNGKIVFRLRLRFINPNDRQINIQFLNIAAYWGAKFTKENDKIVSVESNGTHLTSIEDNNGFIIQANSTTDKDFYLETKWVNILKILGTGILNIITNNLTVNDFIGRPVLIKGTIKAEGFQIPVLTDVTITNADN